MPRPNPATHGSLRRTTTSASPTQAACGGVGDTHAMCRGEAMPRPLRCCQDDRMTDRAGPTPTARPRELSVSDFDEQPTMIAGSPFVHLVQGAHFFHSLVKPSRREGVIELPLASCGDWRAVWYVGTFRVSAGTSGCFDIAFRPCGNCGPRNSSPSASNRSQTVRSRSGSESLLRIAP